ncbi:hypothetical protein L4C39_03255 [Vibrio clamense]|uniref:hypothetical protein n=1 Tax=Vibrio clamense TaxID=2910254 RepID=UPI003D213659
MKIVNKIGVAAVIFSSYAFATSEWSPDQVYTSGDVVTWKGDIYISSQWTKGSEPVVNNISWDGWVFVDTPEIQDWEPNKVYQGGGIVRQNADHYIAKWWSKDDIPSNSSAWRKLSDFNVNPPTPPASPVLGKDEDNNGIRDDYELAVSSMYPMNKQKYTQIAIAASYVWKKQTEVALDSSIIMSPESAALAYNEELALDRCFVKLRSEDPDYVAPHLAYYNNLERALMSRIGHERIAKMIGDNTELIQIPTEPCVGYSKEVS